MKSNHIRHFDPHATVEIPQTYSRSLKSLLKTTYNNWIVDNGPRLAAALAYYALFSLAPLLMIAMAIAGATLGRESAEAALELRFYGLVGKTGAQVIQQILQDAHSPGMGTLTGLAGCVLLLIGASAIFVELQDAFNTIWHTARESGSLWKIVLDRFFSFGLVLIAEILLIISVLLTTAKAALGRLVPAEWLSSGVSLQVAGILVSLGVTTLLFGMMFKLLPKTHIQWNDVWPAAVATAIMFDIGKLLIALYLGRSLISVYGAASSLVAVVGWMYYSAMILYFGAEFANVYAQAYGSRARQE